MNDYVSVDSISRKSRIKEKITPTYHGNIFFLHDSRNWPPWDFKPKIANLN